MNDALNKKSSQTYDSANNYCQKTFNASLNGFQTAKERSTFITNLKSLDILSYGWTFLGAIKTCGSARCPLSVPYQWQNGVSTNHTLANDFFYQPWLDGSGNCLGLVYKYQMYDDISCTQQTTFSCGKWADNFN
ncbi:hypothetical protein L3Y34_007993 [Caenorhabditis briggsae]|nr:hypothetical protein L3Y34_007993 [Caenorhabditis briggsae]